MDTDRKYAPRIHFVESTFHAYSKCQVGAYEDGDILVIPSEGVVGYAHTWPMALTVEGGELGTLADGWTWAQVIDYETEKGDVPDPWLTYSEGRRIARMLGYPVP